MLSFFKSNKYSPATINSTYYIRECSIHNVYDLNLILQPEKEDCSLMESTTIDLEIKNLPILDLSEKIINAVLKKPIYIYDNNELLKGHKVLFYKEDVEFYRFLLQFHFIDDQFFFATNKVSSSGMLSETEKGKIINQITNRYLGINWENHDGCSIMITDQNDSMLTTVDDVYFNVNYLSGGSIKDSLIKKYAGQTDQTDQKSDFENNVDKYF